MAAKTVDGYLGLPYRVEISRSGEGYFAKLPELPGCTTWTADWHDLDELEWRTQDAMEGWLADAFEDGDEIPEPAGRPEDGFSVTGRLLAHQEPKTVGWRASKGLPGELYGDEHALDVAETEAGFIDPAGELVGGGGRPTIFRWPESPAYPFDVLFLITRAGVFELIERIPGVVARRRELPKGVLPL